MISLDIELIATDGKNQKRILWVAVTSNGVYSGHCEKNRDRHISYHFDGNVFHNWFGEKPQKTITLPSLKDLNNFHQLYSTGFSSNFVHLHETQYKLKKLDAMVSVDTRAYSRGIGVNVFIVQQNRHDLIAEIVRFPPSVTEAHVFFTCNPWIALVLYGNIYEKEQNTSAR